MFRIEEGIVTTWLGIDDLEILLEYMEDEFADDYEAEAANAGKSGQGLPVYTSGLLSKDVLYNTIQNHFLLAQDMMSAAREMLLTIDAYEDMSLSEPEGGPVSKAASVNVSVNVSDVLDEPDDSDGPF